MGKTTFSGPVFGAKSLLFASSPGTVSTGASTAVFGATVVPANEDWFVTEIATFNSTNSSNTQFTFKSKIAGTAQTMRVVNVGASTTGQNIITSVGQALGGGAGSAPSASIPLGYYLPAGSTLRLLSSAINPISGVHVAFHGWRQWVNVGDLNVATNFQVSTRSGGN